MKATRILLLGFTAALLATAVTVEPAAAQCWSCGWGGMLVDKKPTICRICTGDKQGYQACGTPTCGSCFNLGACSVELSLDGRSAAPETPSTPTFEESGEERVIEATFASAERGTVALGGPRTRRSCDGGIVSRSYSASAVRAARQATEHLRL